MIPQPTERQKQPNKLQVEFTETGLRIIIDNERDAREALKRWKLGKQLKGPPPKICLHTQVDSFGSPIDKYYLDVKSTITTQEGE